MFILQRFHGDDGTLTPNHTHIGAFGDIGRLISYSLPDVTVDLHTSEAIGLDGLYHPTLTIHQRIGITHATILSFTKIAFGEGTHPKQADKGKYGKDDQLEIETTPKCSYYCSEQGTNREADDKEIACR